jgi:hypothetical protein
LGIQQKDLFEEMSIAGRRIVCADCTPVLDMLTPAKGERK